MDTHLPLRAADSPGDRRDTSPAAPAESNAAGEQGWITQARDALGEAIGRLNRDEQWAVIGYYYEDRSVDELAQSHGVTVSQVRGFIQEALGKLRQIVFH